MQARSVSPLLNFMFYQAAWFACILGAANEQPLIGVFACLGVVLIHLLSSPVPARELLLILTTGVIGGSWETLLVQAEWVQYPGGSRADFPPAWILALWLAFATILNGALRWLHGRYGLTAVLGALGGPLAWYAGSRMGALTLPDPRTDLCIMALGWAVLMPVLIGLAERFSPSVQGGKLKETNDV